MAYKSIFSLLIVGLMIQSLTCHFVDFELAVGNSTDPVPQKIKNIITTLGGFANSSGLYEAMPTMHDLETDEYELLQKFFEAFNVFKDMTPENYIQVLTEGTNDIGELFKQASKIISKADKFAKEADYLIEVVLATIKDKNYYVNFLKNLLHQDIFQIFNYVSAIKVEYAAGDFYSVGNNIGLLFRKLFIVDEVKKLLK